MKSEIDTKICSRRRSDIIEALFKLGGDYSGVVSEVNKNQVLNLVRHSDADIREKAVNLAGIHWRDMAAFPVLLALVAGEEKDQSVLTTVCAALGTLVVYNKLADFGKVTRLLSKIIENQ
jgi:hypothetical protein